MQVEHRSKRFADGSVEIRLLLYASAELDSRTPWPEHFVESLQLILNDTLILDGRFGPGLSPDPFFSFRLAQTQPGDRLQILWRDNRNHQGKLTIPL